MMEQPPHHHTNPHNRRSKKATTNNMDFSVDEIPDHLWSPPIHDADDDHSSKMSLSASEWAFQRFLQASTSATSLPSSSSSSVANGVFFVEIDERSKQDIGPAPLPNGVVLPNGPPPVVVDPRSTGLSSRASSISRAHRSHA